MYDWVFPSALDVLVGQWKGNEEAGLSPHIRIPNTVIPSPIMTPLILLGVCAMMNSSGEHKVGGGNFGHFL